MLHFQVVCPSPPNPNPPNPHQEVKQDKDKPSLCGFGNKYSVHELGRLPYILGLKFCLWKMGQRTKDGTRCSLRTLTAARVFSEIGGTLRI